MATEKAYKRKKLNLNVKKEFQRWLLLRVLVTVGISALLAAVILYFYARQEIVGSFFDAHVKLRRVSDLLLPVVAAGSLVSLMGGGFLALFLPQKIAGPIFRIERGLDSVQEGDLTTRVTLRAEDTLQDFAATVTETVVSLQDRVQLAKESARQLEAAIQAADQADQQQLGQLIRTHRQHLDALKT